MDRKENIDIRDKLKEQQLEKIDKEIQGLYKEFDLESLGIFDFEYIEDYYDLTNHTKLYKIYENRLTTKRFKYESRHEKYKLQRLENKLLENEVA